MQIRTPVDRTLTGHGSVAALNRPMRMDEEACIQSQTTLGVMDPAVADVVPEPLATFAVALAVTRAVALAVV